MTNPFTGAGYFFSGIKLINNDGIRRYVVIPLLINIIIFSLGLWFAISQFNIFIDWALSFLPDWLSWLEWFLWPMFALTFYGLVFFSFSIVANIISAPFNGPLAFAVEHHITGIKPSESNKTLVAEIKESLANELVKIKYALYLMMPLIFLSLISLFFPLIAPPVAALWMIYTIWVLTLEYADFPMSNNGILFPQIREKLANKRILSLGFGSVVLIATMIPLINFIVMPVAVAGATKMYLKEFKA